MSDFKMAPGPELMTDTGIHRLWDLLPSSVPPRSFDLRYEYTSFAPEHSRWTCIDLSTYDGAPDSEAPSTFIGCGASEKQARMDLLEQFADYDEAEYQRKRAKPSEIVHSSAFEPPTYADPVRDPSEDDLAQAYVEPTP